MEGTLARTPMRLSADDVLDIPLPDHLCGYELENGELVEVSLPSPPHGRLSAQIARHLGNFSEEHVRGGVVYGCAPPLDHPH